MNARTLSTALAFGLVPNLLSAQCLDASSAVNADLVTLEHSIGCDPYVDLYIRSYVPVYPLNHDEIGPDTLPLQLSIPALAGIADRRRLARITGNSVDESLEIALLFYSLTLVLENNDYDRAAKQLLMATLVSLVAGSDKIAMSHFSRDVDFDWQRFTTFRELEVLNSQEEGLCFWRNYIPGLTMTSIIESEMYHLCIVGEIYE